jgi:acylphosphatase
MLCPHAHDDRGWLLSEIERLRARVAELSDLVGYIAGRNNDQIRVMLAGNPDACDRLIERARAALEDKP